MIAVDMGNRRKTRYRNVWWRGDDVLYYRYKDHTGVWREVKYGAGNPKDADSARHARQEIEDKVRAGLIDPREATAMEHARNPLEAELHDYESRLIAKGSSRRHIDETLRMIRRWADECAVRCLADADAARFDRWLSDLGVSARTRVAYRTAVLSLYRWAQDYGRLTFHPLPPRLIARPNVEADRRRHSRAMSHDEFDALMMSTPLRRRAFYAVCALTGLRWSEVGRIHWTQLDGHTMTVPASQTKNDKHADVPVTARLTAILKEYGDRFSRDGKMFRSIPRPRTWRRDLVRAGLCTLIDPKAPDASRYDVPNLAGYADDRGHILDRKCLRMTYCTWLKAAGVDIRDVQRLMRHSNVNLTAKVYTDVRMMDLHRASESASNRSKRRDVAG